MESTAARTRPRARFDCHALGHDRGLAALPQGRRGTDPLCVMGTDRERVTIHDQLEQLVDGLHYTTGHCVNAAPHHRTGKQHSEANMPNDSVACTVCSLCNREATFPLFGDSRFCGKACSARRGKPVIRR